MDGSTHDAFGAGSEFYLSIANPADKTGAAHSDDDGHGYCAEFAVGGDAICTDSRGKCFVSMIVSNNNNIKEAILIMAIHEGSLQ